MSEKIQLVTKDDKIKEEYERLSEIFKDVDENKRKGIDTMLRNLAFMTVELDELQEEIKNSGTVETYENGKHQRGIKPTAKLQAFNSLLKSFDTLQAKLLKYIPEKYDYDDDEL